MLQPHLLFEIPYTELKKRMFSFSLTGGRTYRKITMNFSLHLPLSDIRTLDSSLEMSGGRGKLSAEGLTGFSIRNRNSQQSGQIEAIYGPGGAELVLFVFVLCCFVLFDASIQPCEGFLLFFYTTCLPQFPVLLNWKHLMLYSK